MFSYVPLHTPPLTSLGSAFMLSQLDSTLFELMYKHIPNFPSLIDLVLTFLCLVEEAIFQDGRLASKPILHAVLLDGFPKVLR